jgi:DNA-binding CsgD family transcriptional regulator/pimeloyl-ACP methyl ester carboxylesterase
MQVRLHPAFGFYTAIITATMEAPPVQYVRTEDGYDIAYTVCGEGLPFVFMPWPFSHRGLWWQTAFGRPVAQALADRFRLVQYDSRGQGMSTRGLPEYVSIDDYMLDLEAVVDRLVLDRFVLYGGPTFFHVAVRYALRHPERVAALVLGDVAWHLPGNTESSFESLARRDWDFFLHTIVSSLSLQGAPHELPYWRESITRDDWLRMSESARKANITDLLPRLKVPTLILQNRRLAHDEPVSAFAEFGQAAAALIPGAHLILFDGWASVWYSEGDEPPQAVLAMEDFLRGVPEHRAEPPAGPPPAGLTPREIEVLRLVVDGKTNREIAEMLFISERTVINHLSNIFTKTGAENRAAAAAFALRHGLA